MVVTQKLLTDFEERPDEASMKAKELTSPKKLERKLSQDSF